MTEKCALCGREEKLLEHHASYEPEKTVRICKSCHWKVTRQIRDRGGRKLCGVCGKHFTSNEGGVCWSCTHEKKTWWGMEQGDNKVKIWEGG